jgi:hypothetical protein
VYSDPSDDLDVEVQAATESEAIKLGHAVLAEMVEAAEPCGCDRRLAPNRESWWNSVAVHARPVEVHLDDERDWCVMVDDGCHDLTTPEGVADAIAAWRAREMLAEGGES